MCNIAHIFLKYMRNIFVKVDITSKDTNNDSAAIIMENVDHEND